MDFASVVRLKFVIEMCVEGGLGLRRMFGGSPARVRVFNLFLLMAFITERKEEISGMRRGGEAERMTSVSLEHGIRVNVCYVNSAYGKSVFFPVQAKKVENKFG